MAINLAVDCVGQANDMNLTNELVKYLMGDKDGVPKVLLQGVKQCAVYIINLTTRTLLSPRLF